VTDTTELHWWTARRQAAAIRARELSAREVVGHLLDRITALNPRLNAIVSLQPERALAEADAADRRLARGEPVGVLHGLPIAIKDLEDTAGIRTTYGSRAFAEHVPDADCLLVERLRAAGAIVVGKTNTPEFGVGSQTFNQVFGATRNPWAPDRTAGGSSGGAGAALAAGTGSTMSSACARRPAWSRTAARATPGIRTRSTARWRGPSATWR
jgi:amidase